MINNFVLIMIEGKLVTKLMEILTKISYKVNKDKNYSNNDDDNDNGDHTDVRNDKIVTDNINKVSDEKDDIIFFDSGNDISNNTNNNSNSIKVNYEKTNLFLAVTIKNNFNMRMLYL